MHADGVTEGDGSKALAPPPAERRRLIEVDDGLPPALTVDP